MLEQTINLTELTKVPNYYLHRMFNQGTCNILINISTHYLYDEKKTSVLL